MIVRLILGAALLITVSGLCIEMALTKTRERSKLSVKSKKNIPNNDDQIKLLEDVNEYFDIEVTETETEFLVGVKRKSDGEDMMLSMGLCDFPEYIDYWYGMEAVHADDGSHRYALKKGNKPIDKPDPELSDVQEIHLWVEMFICEHPYAFKIIPRR